MITWDKMIDSLDEQTVQQHELDQTADRHYLTDGTQYLAAEAWFVKLFLWVVCVMTLPGSLLFLGAARFFNRKEQR